jgi:hypothetical protein
VDADGLSVGGRGGEREPAPLDGIEAPGNPELGLAGRDRFTANTDKAIAASKAGTLRRSVNFTDVGVAIGLVRRIGLESPIAARRGRLRNRSSPLKIMLPAMITSCMMTKARKSA